LPSLALGNDESTLQADWSTPAEVAKLTRCLSEVTAVTITRVGTNSKYASGWQSAFGKGGSAVKKEGAKATKKVAKKKAAKKAKK
jgi:hypothetical protein